MTNKINQENKVKDQYQDDQGLVIRKRLHDRYSTNKQGLQNWIYACLDLPESGKFLEVGSGNGDFAYKHKLYKRPGLDLSLSDFSMGMVAVMKEKFPHGTDIQQVDVQDLPFEDESFDIVLANAMLYHVPDLDKALKEISRVLKPGGRLYATTFGENGLTQHIHAYLGAIGFETQQTDNFTFTLQNGQACLIKHFSQVDRLDYEDRLLIDDPKDLVDYIFSMNNFSSLDEDNKVDLANYLMQLKSKTGWIEIPKEYVCFICQK